MAQEGKTAGVFIDGMRKLVQSWEKCIAVNGADIKNKCKFL